MPRPGTDVVLRDTPSTISVPTDTGVAFFAGTTDKGSATAPKAIYSITEFETSFGARQNYSPLYDSVELFFREGGYKAYIARVVGPAASSGTRNLVDNVAAISLVATAVGPGAWSANYKVAVVAGVGAGTFKIQVTDASNVVLEDSGDLLTQAQAVQWSQSSAYIRLTLGASALNPTPAAAAALSAGADDRLNITDAQWATAYALFTADLGPGQILGPGRTTDAGHAQLVTHAQNNRRVALLDAPDSPTSGTLTASAAAARSRYAAMFAPWVVIPGVEAGTFRTVPPSALIAGMIARNDGPLGPNHPSAGRFGVSRFAYDLSQPDWDDTTRGTLNTASVNVIRRLRGAITNYGWRSTVAAASDANWVPFGNARLYMAIAAECDEVAENYVFEEIDGQNGNTINSFHDGLAGVCMAHYLARELFGDTAEQAFSVDVGPAVNTLTTIANNELHAVVAVRMAPMAEWVKIEIVKRAVTEGV